MRRLNLYIGGSLFQNIVMAVAVLTFVLISGSLFKAFELLSRGISISVVGRFLFYMLPFALQFTLPLAVLFAAVLVFSRMSADNEIAAMRASGVSLWQIISPGLVMAAILSALCFWLQLEYGPECRYRAHELKSEGGIKNPLAFLEPGRGIHLGQHIVFIGEREDNRVRDIQIYRLGDNGIEQDVRAMSGTLSYDELHGQLELGLEDAVIATPERGREGKAGSGMQRTETGVLRYRIDFSRRMQVEDLDRKAKYMSLRRILSTIYIHNKNDLPTSSLYVELHKRMALAFSPIGFFLIGIPFGIRTKRSEASIGIVVALLLTVLFYVFLVLGESLSEHPRYHPEILVWIPNILYQIGGLIALHRISRR